MALTRYLNLHLKMHFLAIYSMQKTSGHFNIFCPSGPTMVCIRAKLKVVKFYGKFSQYNFEKLIQPQNSYIFSTSNDLTQMVNFPICVPDCDSYNPVLLYFILQWLSLHCEILIILLSQFPLTFSQTQNRMPCFIT